MQRAAAATGRYLCPRKDHVSYRIHDTCTGLPNVCSEFSSLVHKIRQTPFLNFSLVHPYDGVMSCAQDVCDDASNLGHWESGGCCVDP